MDESYSSLSSIYNSNSFEVRLLGGISVISRIGSSLFALISSG